MNQTLWTATRSIIVNTTISTRSVLAGMLSWKLIVFVQSHETHETADVMGAPVARNCAIANFETEVSLPPWGFCFASIASHRTAHLLSHLVRWCQTGHVSPSAEVPWSRTSPFCFVSQKLARRKSDHFQRLLRRDSLRSPTVKNTLISHRARLVMKHICIDGLHEWRGDWSAAREEEMIGQPTRATDKSLKTLRSAKRFLGICLKISIFIQKSLDLFESL